MFSKEERCVYGKNQLEQVICQLRFPEILSIEAKLPADFQEAIRDEFPVYSSRKEQPAPRIAGAPGQMNLEKPQPVTNYEFASADGVWRVNLTRNFISLSCSRYTRWEEFAGKLDKPLAAFIRIYKPAWFIRVGLRYVNFISRNNLGLEGESFRNLIHARYLGILADEEIRDEAVSRCSVDTEFAIRAGCRVKIHAGIGKIKRGREVDPEEKFIFDQDLYMGGKLPVNLSAGALQTLHSQAFAIFRDAITDRLHNAMEP